MIPRVSFAQVEALPATRLEGGILWSTVVPALLFAIALAATWLLYRHFSRRG